MPVPSNSALLAYVGPGAGMELFTYFLGLLAWVVVALGAILMWPVYSLLARFRKSRNPPPAEPKSETANANVPEGPGAGSSDQP